jgi:hypothetical protein
MRPALKSKGSRTDQAIDVRTACLAHCFSCVNFDIVIDGHVASIFVFSKRLCDYANRNRRKGGIVSHEDF